MSRFTPAGVNRLGFLIGGGVGGFGRVVGLVGRMKGGDTLGSGAVIVGVVMIGALKTAVIG